MLQAQATKICANPRLLVIDDEERIRRLVVALLQSSGYMCESAPDVASARRILDETAIDLVLTDMNLPGDSGLDLLRALAGRAPDTAVVMVTAEDNAALGGAALELGAYGYVIKPFKNNELVIQVANALRRRRLEVENRAHRQNLEALVAERTREVRLSEEETIQRLAKAAELRDNETGHHIERMSAYSALIARRLGFPDELAEQLRLAAAMHDVGKIGIPDAVLRKPGRHTEAERDVMRSHAELGRRILAGSPAAILEMGAIIAWTHHEKFDGSGYPRGLRGDAIPIEGRIVAVADVFDALMSARVYKPALPLDEVLAIMRAESGKHFDPAVLEAFLGALDEVADIARRYPG
jgi:putative two-component system response regulator